MGHDEREAITDEAPVVIRPRLAGKRTPKQCRGSTYIDMKQEPPGEKIPQRMSIHIKEDPRTEGAHRGKFPERKHLKAGAYRSKMESAQYGKAKETAAERAPEGPNIHRFVRGHPTQSRKDPDLVAEQEPLEAQDPIKPMVNLPGGKQLFLAIHNLQFGARPGVIQRQRTSQGQAQEDPKEVEQGEMVIH